MMIMVVHHEPYYVSPCQHGAVSPQVAMEEMITRY